MNLPSQMTMKARKKIRSALIVFHGSVLKQKTEEPNN